MREYAGRIRELGDASRAASRYLNQLVYRLLHDEAGVIKITDTRTGKTIKIANNDEHSTVQLGDYVFIEKRDKCPKTIILPRSCVYLEHDNTAEDRGKINT